MARVEIDPQFESLIRAAQSHVRANDPSFPPSERDYFLAGFGYVADRVSEACNGRGGKLKALVPYAATAGAFVGGLLWGLKG